MLAGVVTIQCDGLIADDTGRTVCRGRIDPMGIHVRFGASDEEGSGQMQHVEAGEIDIAAVHDVDRASLREEQVKCVNVVQFAVRNVDEARDITAQVQQRVHLDRRFGRTEMRPRKDRQTKVDGRRVERIDRVGEVETQILVDVQPSRLDDQSLGQLLRQSRTSLASASVERRTGSRKPME